MRQRLTEWMDKSLPDVVRGLIGCEGCGCLANTEKGFNLAGQQAVHRVVDQLMAILFPGCHGADPVAHHRLPVTLNAEIRLMAMDLAGQVEQALRFACKTQPCKRCFNCRQKAESVVVHVLESLPAVHETLQADIRAAYDGDPAAMSLMEIVLSYPGLQAIAIHRLAHLLYEKEVPLIPRIMSELAHSRTGIDIHPGARIGPAFFIDHGTGVVIGETSVIGRNVKLYQGVTLGALSFPKDEHGNPIKGIKRHPEVRDDVTIYAGATILGGDTVVGEGSVIGGNVWLTHSVPPHTKVMNQQPKPLLQTRGAPGEKPGA
jgi:serine O-acetyltransferase